MMFGNTSCVGQVRLVVICGDCSGVDGDNGGALRETVVGVYSVLG